MDKIKPIQLPVRYDEKASQLVDAEGAAWLDVDYDDREICEAMVDQIADALNAAADKDRQIAVLTEALEVYAKSCDCGHLLTSHEHGMCFLCNCYKVTCLADKALAESQRIQEGGVSVCTHVRNSGYKTDFCSKCGEYIRGEFCDVCHHPKPSHFEPDTVIPVYCCDGCDGYVESKRIQEGENG